MPSLHLDHNVPLDLVTELAKLGLEATHARFERLDRAVDARHLLFAAERGATMVTQDHEDFKLLHDAWRMWSLRWGVERPHAGILIVPAGLDAPYLARRIAEQVETVMLNELYELLRGSYVWVHHVFRP